MPFLRASSLPPYLSVRAGNGSSDCSEEKRCSDRSWKDVPSKQIHARRNRVVAGHGPPPLHLDTHSSEHQVCYVMCVLFPCLLYSETKIIAFRRSVFLKLF